MKVKVDGALCTGHGRCYSLAPDVFEPDEEGYSAVRDEMIDVPDGEEDAARTGAHACPERAITVFET